MSNLISAGVYRLRYSKLFYILLVLLVAALTLCYMQAIPQTISLEGSTSEVTQEEGYMTVEYAEQVSTYPLNYFFFQYVLANLISCGVFCSLFLGPEYGDGVLRNKLIVGRSRSQIYLGNLAVNGLYGTVASAAGILTGLCVGVPMLKGFGETEPSTLVMYGIFSLITTWACVSLFTMVTMAVSNRAVAAASCIVLAFALYFLAQFLTLNLSQPEMLQGGLIFGQDGTIRMADPAPNPSYISGFKRQVYQFLYELTPGGQCFQIVNMNAETPWHLPVYAALVIALTTGLGLAIFQKKDVK
ncbi:MAG TPA: ABC transporter permease subunit [Candidatus Galloscillospira excrementavium]|nr:ABC transporter permease subunit [Candidatus Galloscillospira excrementavium]